ncbi:hypothetical protein ACJJTC_002147 [Scirpophaga incertulas]
MYLEADGALSEEELRRALELCALLPPRRRHHARLQVLPHSYMSMSADVPGGGRRAVGGGAAARAGAVRAAAAAAPPPRAPAGRIMLGWGAQVWARSVAQERWQDVDVAEPAAAVLHLAFYRLLETVLLTVYKETRSLRQMKPVKIIKWKSQFSTIHSILKLYRHQFHLQMELIDLQSDSILKEKI